MSEKNTGGLAFPQPDTYHLNGQVEFGSVGMTLRDWFAGKELAKAEGCAVCDEPAAYDRLAQHCYRMADAMLKAREE